MKSNNNSYPIYHIDAFTNKLFSGNPAAVCPLDNWLTDEQMINIAFENNLSETAFYIIKDDEYELRWFTPKAEIQLCGHATLATAFVIYEIFKSAKSELRFHTRSGLLTVTKAVKGYTLNFPADVYNITEVTSEMKQAIGKTPVSAYYGRDVLMLVLADESELKSLSPDFDKVCELHKHGLIVTAPGSSSDFSSRCFFPHFGINEDPVTGSAHTMLIPYWASRLNKSKLFARQLSARSGELHCELAGDRVNISGEAVIYSEGKIFI